MRGRRRTLVQRFLMFPAALLSAVPVFAADSLPHPAYRIETVAGSANMGDGGPALAAQVGAIQGVAVDRLGNIYLSDTDHSRVRRVSVSGAITTVAGTGDA